MSDDWDVEVADDWEPSDVEDHWEYLRPVSGSTLSELGYSRQDGWFKGVRIA